MAAMLILDSVAAIIVAVIMIRSTAPVSRQRLRAQRGVRVRQELGELAQRVGRFRSEPALVEFEARYDELAGAYQTKETPFDLGALWVQVFRVVGETPLGTPFRFGALEVHRDMNAMTVRKGSRTITGRVRLEAHPIPSSPRSAMKPSGAPIPTIKERS